MTPSTLNIIDIALQKYENELRFALDLRDFVKGHTVRRNTAALLWRTRKARIELDLRSPRPAQRKPWGWGLL
jgi:hypothetical protein